MLAPGTTFSASRAFVTAGAALQANFINEGVGFMNDGSLAIDTDPPAGNVWDGGVRQNASGSIYGTTATAGSDVYIRGLRHSAIGQLIYESAAAVAFNNGDPLTSNGLFAVTP